MSQFDELTPAQKRVAIAKDVLLQLGKGLTPARQRYLSPKESTDIIELPGDDDLQCHVDLLQGRCTACALGSLLLSRARCFDEVPTASILRWGTLSADRHKVVAALYPIFSDAQCQLIEAAFEGCWHGDWLVISLKQFYGAVVFASEYTSAKERLGAIAKNIVENEGEFKVEDASQEDYEWAVDLFYEMTCKSLLA